MKLQKLLSLTRQAIDAYGMIEENDKIAVGISGGKDSLNTSLCTVPFTKVLSSISLILWQ